MNLVEKFKPKLTPLVFQLPVTSISYAETFLHLKWLVENAVVTFDSYTDKRYYFFRLI